MKIFKNKKNIKISVPKKWLDIGIKEPQEVIDTINEACKNLEHLDASVYLGKTKYGNICICLSVDKKIENAFPVKITKAEFLRIKSEIEKIEWRNNVSKSVTLMFIATDLYNHKDEIKELINKSKYKFSYDLFCCYGEGDILVIDWGEGKIAIGKNVIEKFIN